MKLRMLQDMGVHKADSFLYPRSDEQGQRLIENGMAEQVEDDIEEEKVLVLKNPTPGTYTTEMVPKSETTTLLTPDEKGENVATTVKTKKKKENE